MRRLGGLIGLFSTVCACLQVYPGELGSGSLGSEHPDRLPSGDRGAGWKRLETLQPGGSLHQLCVYGRVSPPHLTPRPEVGFRR